MTTAKACNKCGIIKPLDEFHKDKSHTDGKKSLCKKCVNETNIKWQKDNPEIYIECINKWKENNTKKIKDTNKKYYKNNSKRIKELCAKWRKENPEKHKENCKKWAKNNPEKIKGYDKKWKGDNCERMKQKRKIWSQTHAGKTSNAKCHARRNRDLGYITLNNRFEGSEGHHITPLYVIHIPKTMHISMRHSLGDVSTMHKINRLAIDFLNEQRITSPCP